MLDKLNCKNVTKGELNMKKTILVLALATALVFSFAALAGATEYRGFSPLNSSADGPAGFVSWATAQAQMTANAARIETGIDVGTVHGGYVTATSKCFVCHSVHRATGIPTGTPGFQGGSVNNQLFLTAADGGSCTVCHTDWGSGDAELLVEWAQVDPGPHDTVGSCGACHRGGIHGRDTSRYSVMNFFMLGGAADAQITAEFNVAEQAISGRFDAPMAPRASGAPFATGAGWWANGSTVDPGRQMGRPATGAGTGNHATFAFARSLATGATCGLSDCHEFGAFHNAQWGAGFDRMNPDAAGTVEVTGHAVPGAYGRQFAGIGCGPCHPGGSAGLPTAASRDNQWRQQGCNQCHDMVGVATNSIAFPHGNRNIDVYEWAEAVPATGAPTVTALSIEEQNEVDEGNLWMYAGNLARRAGAGSSSAIGNIANYATTEWRVMTGVTSGEFVANTTGLLDGACLKCHIAADSNSLENTGPQGAFMSEANAAGVGGGWGDFANRGHGWNAGRFPYWVDGGSGTNQFATGSARMHLYR